MKRSHRLAALRRLAQPAVFAASLALALLLVVGGGLPSRPALAQPSAGSGAGTHMTGDMTGHMAGHMTGRMTGRMTGHMTGRMTGNMAEHGSTTGAAAALAAVLAEADVVVELSGFTFSPTLVTIEPGQTVTWVRRSGFHNVAADDGSYRSGAVSDTWQSFSHTFTDVGESLYHCEAHGGPGGVGMAGKVVVQVSGQGERKLYLPVLVRQPE